MSRQSHQRRGPRRVRLIPRLRNEAERFDRERTYFEITDWDMTRTARDASEPSGVALTPQTAR
ncbi:MAG: hypothetical protein ACR2KI_08515 [Candidatus Limnocylindria bacterium]